MLWKQTNSAMHLPALENEATDCASWRPVMTDANEACGTRVLTPSERRRLLLKRSVVRQSHLQSLELHDGLQDVGVFTHANALKVLRFVDLIAQTGLVKFKPSDLPIDGHRGGWEVIPKLCYSRFCAI